MIRLKPLLAAMAIAALAACSPKGTDTKDGSVATVDGQPISRNTYLEYVKSAASKPAEDLTEQERDRYLQNLVRAQVIAAAAQREGIDVLGETRAALDLGRYQILQQASTQAYLKDRKPSSEELRAEYDIQIAQMDKAQYRTAHIQTATEDTAKLVLAQLKAGAGFAQLARTMSTDAGSREKGGELDWSSPGNMPPAYAAAVVTLKKGETATAPVRTEYGFHVIRVLDVRDAPPPSFDSVRERLVEIVQEKKWKAYVDTLVEKAKVEKSL